MSVALALKATVVPASNPATSRSFNGREKLVFVFIYRFGMLSRIPAMLTASAGAWVSPIPGMAQQVEAGLMLCPAASGAFGLCVSFSSLVMPPAQSSHGEPCVHE